MYGIAITYGVVGLLLLGGFAYLIFKMTSKKWKRLLLALLLFSSPAYSKLTEEGAKKMGNTLLNILVFFQPSSSNCLYSFLAFFLYLRKYAYIGFHIGVDDYENSIRNDERN